MAQRNSGIGGTGDPTVFELVEFLQAIPGEARVSLRQWGASGDGYGEVEAGWKIEAFW